MILRSSGIWLENLHSTYSLGNKLLKRIMQYHLFGAWKNTLCFFPYHGKSIVIPPWRLQVWVWGARAESQSNLGSAAKLCRSMCKKAEQEKSSELLKWNSLQVWRMYGSSLILFFFFFNSFSYYESPMTSWGENQKHFLKFPLIVPLTFRAVLVKIKRCDSTCW